MGLFIFFFPCRFNRYFVSGEGLHYCLFHLLASNKVAFIAKLPRRAPWYLRHCRDLEQAALTPKVCMRQLSGKKVRSPHFRLHTSTKAAFVHRAGQGTFIRASGTFYCGCACAAGTLLKAKPVWSEAWGQKMRSRGGESWSTQCISSGGNQAALQVFLWTAKGSSCICFHNCFYFLRCLKDFLQLFLVLGWKHWEDCTADKRSSV